MKKISILTFLATLCAVAAWAAPLDVLFKPQVDPGIWGTDTIPGTHNCGPTSVLMVAAYHMGFVPAVQHIKDLDDWTVSTGMFASVNGYNGNNMGTEQLAQMAREYYGFGSVTTKYYDNNLEPLRQSLNSGNPVIVGVKIDMTTLKGGHFMVLIGMTDTDVIVNDPGRSVLSNMGNHHPYPITQFLASWKTQHYATIIINGSASRSTVLGQKVDGTVVPEILSAYFHNGCSSVLGTPIPSINPFSNGYVTEWPWPSSGILFQMFNGGLLGECAIVNDIINSSSKAFVMHGQLWSYYVAHDGPSLIMPVGFLGGPIANEQYAIDNYNGHQLVVQTMAHGYLMYDTVTGFADARSDNSSFHFATLPSNGTTLQGSAYAMSPTSVQVNGSHITNASSHAVYEDNILVGYLDPNPLALNLLLTNRTPGSTHTYQLVAYDSQGTTLATSVEFPLTLPTVSTPTTLNITATASTTSIEVTWSAVAGTAIYDVSLDGTVMTTTSNLSVTLNNVASTGSLTHLLYRATIIDDTSLYIILIN